MRRSNLGSVSMEGRIPMAERTSLFRSGSGKRHQRGEGSEGTHRGASLADGGTLLLNGGEVSLGSLTVDGGMLDLGGESLALDCLLFGGGGALVVDSRGTLDLSASLPDFAEAERQSQALGPIFGGGSADGDALPAELSGLVLMGSMEITEEELAELEPDCQVLDKEGMLLVPLRVRFVVDGRAAHFDLWPDGDVTEVNDCEIPSPHAPAEEPRAIEG